MKDRFDDSLKTLGKYVLFGLKNLWKNALKPKAIILAKGVELGKDLLKENKGNIQKIVSKKSQGILKKLLSKDKVTRSEGSRSFASTKQDLSNTLSNTKNDLIDLAKENRDRVSERSKEILDKLLYGEGLKILR